MRKHSFWIFLVLICLLPVMALAADDARTMKPLPADMVMINWVEGLELTGYSVTDGQISMDVDVEKTDWPLVMMNTGAISEFGLNYYIRIPEGADFLNTRMGNAFTDEEIDNTDFWAEQEEWGNYERNLSNAMEMDGVRYINTGSRLATWVEEMESIVIDETFENEYLLLRWYDYADGEYKPIATHKLKITRTATAYGMIPVGNALHISDDDRIVVDVNENLDHVKVDVKDGVITLTPQNENASCRDDQMTVWVEFPENAVKWAGFHTEEPWDPNVEQDGKKYALWDIWGVRINNTNAMQTNCFWFYDEEGNVVEKFPLKLKKNPMAGSKPMEEYMQEVTGGQLEEENWTMDWKTVPQSKMLITSVIPSSVYKINYANGMIKTSISGQGHDLVNYRSQGETIDILAPAGAKSYRANNSGDAWWGPEDPGRYYEKHYSVVDQEAQPVINGKARVWDSGEVLRAIPVAGSNLTVYFPVQYNNGNPYYKQTNIIYFYDVLNPTWETKPIAQWYYTRMDDDNYFLTAAKASYRSEDEIPEGLTDPCIVDPKGRDLELRVRYYLQGGRNARHFELSVVDRNGKPIKLKKNEGVYVYLPYTASSDKKHWVHHFGNDLYTAQNPKYDRIEVENTSKGLRFYTESFSPFVLNWDAELVSITLANGTLSCDGVIVTSGQFEVGSEVTLMANVPAGKVFKGWMGLDGVQFLDGYTKDNATTQFIVPAADLNIFALWTDAPAGTVSQPPKTGDNAPLMLWFALAALSAAGMVIMLQKRRHS